MVIPNEMSTVDVYNIFEKLNNITKKVTQSSCEKYMDFNKDLIRMDLITLNKKMNKAVVCGKYQELQDELIPQLLEIAGKY